MFKKSKYQKIRDIATLSDHLANERTFLAWIRTSIGIMAFGFVVEKFSLFLKQMASFLGKEHLLGTLTSPSLQGYSSILGITLVSLGALLCVLASIKYKHIEQQIDQSSYSPSPLLDIMLTLSIGLIGIFLVIILIK